MTLHSVLDGAMTDEELLDGVTYKGAKLIPFPNRISDGSYMFNGKQYQLPINHVGHAIHGLVYDQPFSPVGLTANDKYAEVILRYRYPAAVAGYPFPFEVTLKMSLSAKQGFRYDTIITNSGSKPMPVGDGWHPYFRTRGTIDRLHFHLPASSRLEIDERRIPTGRLVREHYADGFVIGSTEFAGGYVVDDRSGRTLTSLFDPDIGVTVNVWQETGHGKYNYLQVFTPPSRDSIAIEPMTCPANAFNSKRDLIVLAPDEVFQASCGVFLS